MEVLKTLEKYSEKTINCKIIIEAELTDLNNYIKNNRTNKFMANKIKRQNQDICAIFINSQIKKRIEKPAFIIIKWYSRNKKKDPDNIAFAKKFILDALVENNILKNDGQNQITGFADLFYTAKNPKIEVDIITES